METILNLQNVSVFYDEKPALTDISLEIPKQQITSIIGPSGCGKSTLLRRINRMVEEEAGVKTEGNIFLKGCNINALPRDELRRQIGLVSQIPAPFPFSIYKNLTYAPKYYGIHNKEKLHQIAVEKLTMTGLYHEVKADLNKSALKLSGGQQQRLCIARALTVDPDVLMLDEPCSALDVRNTAMIEDLLLELKKRYTIVLVTHNMAQARRVSDHVVFLLDGHLIETGEKESFFEHPSRQETCSFLQGVLG